MSQQYCIDAGNDGIKESQNVRANKRSLRLSALLSTTAMAFFLEACGAGSDGRPTIVVDESTAGGVNNVSRRIVIDRVTGDQAEYQVTTRDVAPGELPQIDGQDITSVTEVIQIDEDGNPMPDSDASQAVIIDGGTDTITVDGNTIDVSVIYERTFLPGDRQIVKISLTFTNSLGREETRIVTEYFVAGESEPYLTEYRSETLLSGDSTTSEGAIYRIDIFADEDFEATVGSPIVERKSRDTVDGQVVETFSSGNNIEVQPVVDPSTGSTTFEPGPDGLPAIFDGSGGNDDTVDYSDATEGINIDLTRYPDSQVNGDILNDIENIIGTDQIDEIIGNEDDNIIEGGDAADVLQGGGGRDTLSYEGSAEPVEVELQDDTTNNVESPAIVNNGDADGDQATGFENIIGSAGRDTLIGNSEDNVIEGGAAGDVLDGGAGTDTLSYEGSALGVSVGLRDGDNVQAIVARGDANLDQATNFENIIGSVESDILEGNSGDNIIEGRAGDDEISGALGDDTIIGGAGSDTIDGGAGEDTVSFETALQDADGNGITLSLGEEGARTTASGVDAQGNSETDSVENIENVIGSQGKDTIDGNSQDNVIEGGGGADTIGGGGGEDTISYENSPEDEENGGIILTLGDGTVSLGEGGHAQGDRIREFENVIGSIGDDQITGNRGDNVIEGGAGADMLDGGAGSDTLSYENSADRVEITLNDGQDALADVSGGDAERTIVDGDVQKDQAINFENIIGSTQSDVLVGNSDDNVIEGGIGADTLDGGAGAGDALSYEGSAEGVSVDLQDGDDVQAIVSGGDANLDQATNFENIIGSEQADMLTGNSDANVIKALGGDDTIEGQEGSDTLDGGDGVDTFVYHYNTLRQDGADIIKDDQGGTLRIKVESASTSLVQDDIFAHFANLATFERVSTVAGSEGYEDLRIIFGTAVDSLGRPRDSIVFQGILANQEQLEKLSIELFDGNGLTNTITGETISRQLELINSLALNFGPRFVSTGISEQVFDGSRFAEGEAEVTYEVTFNSAPNDQFLDVGVIVTLDGRNNGILAQEDTRITFAAGDTFNGIYNITGTKNADTLTGDEKDNRLAGRDGNDRLEGGIGVDTLTGEGGDDTLEGGIGADIIDGGTHTDVGGDTVSYASSSLGVSIALAEGANQAVVSRGDAAGDTVTNVENIIGSNVVGQQDTLTGNSLANKIEGLAGVDIIDGAGGNDILEGGGEDDIIDGGAGNDILEGGEGADTLTGGIGGDTLDGGAGTDTLIGGLGDDTLTGGDGIDTYVYQYFTNGSKDGKDTINEETGSTMPNKIQIVLEDTFGLNFDWESVITLTADAGRILLNFGADDYISLLKDHINEADDTVFSITLYQGSLTSGISSTITAAELANAVNGIGLVLDDTDQGNVGNTLTGGLGNDILIGGGGDDRLIGAEGDDTYVFNAGDGDDTVIDDGGNLVFVAGDIDAGNFVLNSVSDNVEVSILTDNKVTIDNSQSGDSFSFKVKNSQDASAPSLATVSRAGTGGVGSLDGGSGIDILFGTRGDVADTINGLAGEDIIFGGGGNDIIDGGGGADTLEGGAGADTYLFNANDGEDTVTDNGGSLVFNAAVAGNIVAGSFVLNSDNDNVEVSILTGNKVIIDNSQSADSFSFEIKDGVSNTLATVSRAGTGVVGSLDGGSGIDILFGAQGDVADTIDGSAGDDILLGGAGADTYLIDSGDGDDTIIDADGGILQFNDVGDPSEFSFQTLADGVVKITIATTDSVTIYNYADDLFTIRYGTGASEITLGKLFLISSGTDPLVGGDGQPNILAVAHTVSDVNGYTLEGGDSNDAIYGGVGDDTLEGGGGNDSIYGGAADDTLEGGIGADIIDGGTHTDGIGDTVSYASSTGGVSVDLQDGDDVQAIVSRGDAASDVVTNVENIIGSNVATEQDTLTGNSLANKIEGLAGDDTLIGGLGDDTLEGGAGADTLTGGSGDDTLDGGVGVDTYIFNANDGEDTVTDDGGSLVFVAGDIDAGNFVVNSGTSNVEINILTGNKVIIDSSLPDGSFSFEVKNSLTNTLATVSRVGTGGGSSNGIDILFGALGGGADTIDGSTGNDILLGGAGVDTYLFDSGDGDDTINDAGGGILQFNDVGDPSEFSFETLASGAVKITIATTESGTDYIDSVTINNYGNDLFTIRYGTGGSEITLGTLFLISSGTNPLVGDDQQNVLAVAHLATDVNGYTLQGAGGNDIIYGGAGDDTLEGGADSDTLEGGDGLDTYVFSANDGDDTVIDADGGSLVFNAAVVGNIVAGSFAINSGTDNVEVSILTGNKVTIDSSQSADSFSFEIKDDVSNTLATVTRAGTGGGGSLDGGVESDVLFGARGDVADTINGLAGADIIFGGGGNDIIDGGGGADTLEGGAGEDEITGGGGADTLEGGAGADTYLFGSGDGDDTISDADGGILQFNNVVDPSAFSFETLAGGAVKITIATTESGTDYIDSVTINNYGNDLFTIRYGTGGSEITLGKLFLISSGTNPLVGDDQPNVLAVAHLATDVNGYTIEGAGENDIIYGGVGGDILEGGDGDDTIYGGVGDDTLEGGAGDDILEGGDGLDTYIYYFTLRQDGQDTIEDVDAAGSTVVNKLVINIASTTLGNTAAEKLRQAAEEFKIETVDGKDYLTIQFEAQHYIRINAELINNQRLSIEVKDDAGFLEEIINSDVQAIFDAAGTTHLGTAGVDTFAGVNFDRNGAPLDIVSYENSPVGVEVDLQDAIDTAAIVNLGHAENDILTNIGNLIGSAEGDILKGNIFANRLEGGDGVDTLEGEGGDDIIKGEAGGDMLDGGDGDDRLDGGVGDDTLDGGSGENTILGGDGDDTIKGGVGTDTIDGGDDNLGSPDGIGDTISYASSAGGVSVDLQDGDVQAIVSGGDAANDIVTNVENIIGSNVVGEQDTLTGNSGNNKIEGLAGVDTIDGKGGRDTLEGGGEADIYIYKYAANQGETIYTIKDGDGLNILQIELDDDRYASVVSAGTSTIDQMRSAGIREIKVEADGGEDYYKIDFTQNGGSIYILKANIDDDNFQIDFSNTISGITTISAAELKANILLKAADFVFDPTIDQKAIDIDIGEVGNQAYIVNIDKLLVGTTLNSLKNAIPFGVFSAMWDEVTNEFIFQLFQINKDTGARESSNKITITGATSAADFKANYDSGIILSRGTANIVLGDTELDALFVNTRTDGNFRVLDTTLLVLGETGIDDIADFSKLILEIPFDTDFRIEVDLREISDQVKIMPLNTPFTFTYRINLQNIEGIIATDQDDILIGDGGNNNLAGDAGDDTLEGGAGDDILDGGTHTDGIGDTVSYASSSLGVSIALAEGANQAVVSRGDAAGDTVTNVENIIGSNVATEQDTLTGNSLANKIEGLAGDDTLIGGLGDDTLEGGDGIDTYVYQYFTNGSKDGKDTINEETGSTMPNKIQIVLEDTFGLNFDWESVITLTADAGRILLNFGADDYISLLKDHINEISDTVFSITLYQGSLTSGISSTITAAELAIAVNGIDSEPPMGTDNPETINGNGNADTIIGMKGDDMLIGEGGSDTYVFNADDGTDTVIDDGGNLVFVAGDIGAGNFVLNSGTDNVEVSILTGNKVIIDNSQFGDSFSFEVKNSQDTSAPSLATVSRAGTGGGGSLDGGNGIDILFGARGGGADTINGLGGDDIIFGGGGNDILNGGAGNDRLEGGAGNDTYVFNAGEGDDTIIEAGGGILHFKDVDDPNAFSFETDSSGSNLEITYETMAGGNLVSNTVTILNYLANPADPFANRFTIKYGTGTGTDLGKLSFVRRGDDVDARGQGKSVLVSAVLTGDHSSSGLTGSNNDDTIYAGAHGDTITGGAGNDLFIARAGNTNKYNFYSGDGNDILEGENNGNLIFRNSGEDSIKFSINSDQDIVINVASATSVTLKNSHKVVIRHGGLVFFGNLEVARVDAGLTGGSDKDILFGRKGGFADILKGMAGEDILYGLYGDDTLVGGADIDTYVYYYTDSIKHGKDTITEQDSDTNTIRIIVETLPEVDNWYKLGEEMVMGAIAKIIADPDLPDSRILIQFDANNHINLLRSDIDTGKIQLLFEDASGATLPIGVMQLKQAAQEKLPVSVIITGGSGMLEGGVVDDMISGEDGADTLTGNKGDDMLTGGAGSDTYVFNKGDGVDTIIDGGTSNAERSTLQFNDITMIEQLNFVVDTSDPNNLEITFVDNPDDKVVIQWDMTNARSAFKIIGKGGNTLALVHRNYAADGGTGGGFLLADDSVPYNILVGNSYDDTFQGSDISTAVDVIFGEGGSDMLYGLGGNDILEGGADADTIDGGDGEDTVSYASSTSGVTITLADGAGVAATISATVGDDAFGDVVTNVENIIGSISTAADTLTGNMGDNTIEGLAGADKIDGGDGEDTVSYASSTSAVTLTLAAVAGELATVSGGDADGDEVKNVENIIGSNFIDPTDPGNIADTLTGNSGANKIQGLAGADEIYGGSGDDILEGGEGDDIIDGGSGNDILEGGDGDDTIEGGFEADIIDGGAGDDTLSGGGGNDTIDGGADKPSDEGGMGDTVSYASSTSAVTLTLAESAGSVATGIGGDAAGDMVSNVENIIGSIFVDPTDPDNIADTLTGNSGANKIQGLAGADEIYGKGGDDILEGGDGADKLYGGDGVDILEGGDGADTLEGGDGNDILEGGDGADKLYGGDGADILRGGAGADILEGGAEVDKYHFYRADGSNLVMGVLKSNIVKDNGGEILFKEEERMEGNFKRDNFDFAQVSGTENLRIIYRITPLDFQSVIIEDYYLNEDGYSTIATVDINGVVSALTVDTNL